MVAAGLRANGAGAMHMDDIAAISDQHLDSPLYIQQIHLVTIQISMVKGDIGRPVWSMQMPSSWVNIPSPQDGVESMEIWRGPSLFQLWLFSSNCGCLRNCTP